MVQLSNLCQFFGKLPPKNVSAALTLRYNEKTHFITYQHL